VSGPSGSLSVGPPIWQSASATAPGGAGGSGEGFRVGSLVIDPNTSGSPGSSVPLYAYRFADFGGGGGSVPFLVGYAKGWNGTSGGSWGNSGQSGFGNYGQSAGYYLDGLSYVTFISFGTLLGLVR